MQMINDGTAEFERFGSWELGLLWTLTMSGSLSLCGVANPKAATQPIVHDWEHGWSRDWLQCHCWENPGRLVDTHQFCHIYTKCLCSYVIWLSAILLCDVMCHWWPRVLTPYCTAFRCTVHIGLMWQFPSRSEFSGRNWTRVFNSLWGFCWLDGFSRSKDTSANA